MTTSKHFVFYTILTTLFLGGLGDLIARSSTESENFLTLQLGERVIVVLKDGSEVVGELVEIFFLAASLN